jgi:hypothetical protein
MTHERIVRVEPGISVLKIRGQFNETGSLKGFFEAGYFAYKYNEDAINLGEYLHRSNTYPGVLFTTENWQFMNGATSNNYGIHTQLSHLDGMITQDLTFFMETEATPVGDFSPGYELNFNFGFLELGGGFVLNHFLSYKPSKLRPKDNKNRYVEIDTTVITADRDTVPSYQGPFTGLSYSTQDAIDEDSTIIPVASSRWTIKGIKLMGLFALDFGSFFPEGVLSPRDLRLFAEVAVLGLENQPYFYEDIIERIPIMVGFNFPTFKFLELLCFQVERYTTPYKNFVEFNTISLPIWKEENERVTRDDWKWSVYAKKSINSLFNLHIQVANDHIRSLKYDVIKSDIPLTLTPDHWYYLVKFEFGIK